jgi:hypothetical protein
MINININILILVIVLLYFCYFLFISNKIEKLDNYTISIDLSDNKYITETSTKIIYWIVNNNNETYNNYKMNGIVEINNQRINIIINDIEEYSNLELKYYIINKTELGENFDNNMLFSIKIK